MYKYIVLLALVPAFLALDVQKCRDGTLTPASINVTGCTGYPCEVQLGTKAQMILSFAARK